MDYDLFSISKLCLWILIKEKKVWLWHKGRYSTKFYVNCGNKTTQLNWKICNGHVFMNIKHTHHLCTYVRCVGRRRNKFIPKIVKRLQWEKSVQAKIIEESLLIRKIITICLCVFMRHNTELNLCKSQYK